jgi:dUTP pyrophosphatase
MDIEKFFPDDENIDFKKIFLDMGLDLNQLEDEFENFSSKKELRYERLNENVITPYYNYESDSGFDLHSTEDISVEPFGRALVPTGLRFDIPDGTEIQVRPKSGLALKQGLTVLNTPGTVDSGYDGEIKVIVFNTNNSVFEIKKGMKIAQAVLCPVINGKWVTLTQVESIDNKERGDNGFGSTGI